MCPMPFTNRTSKRERFAHPIRITRSHSCSISLQGQPLILFNFVLLMRSFSENEKKNENEKINKNAQNEKKKWKNIKYV